MPREIPDPRLPIPPSSTPIRPEPGETLAVGTDGSFETDALPDLARLLAPPQSPEELGWLAHYRILKVLGRGGMGVVFLAEDTHLQRQVALKVMLPDLVASSAARERFLREARAGAALRSDHVVVVYQVGLDRDVPFLSMELLRGESLDARLQRGERFSSREVVRIGREVADGLAAAHEQGLIHRDIKPANIWLEGEPGASATGGRVKVLDFGLARFAGSRSNLTQTGRVVGTPEFMSPEQARGEELDGRSDLFSLGAVLYALCSGQKPFQGSTVMAVLTALAVDTPRPVCELNPEVPAALGELVGRLLEKDPARRPASAHEVRSLLQAIESAMGGSGGSTVVLAPAPTAPVSPGLGTSPLAVPGRRGPRWLFPAGVLTGVALLGAVGLLAVWSRLGSRGGADTPAAPTGPPIRIGVLHSCTGTMESSEKPVRDAVLLAIKEINDRGGLLGRPVEAVVADGQSEETVFARQAEKLIREDHVCTIFGCWTSASRKAVVPVVERHDHLLIYPVQYEGLEQSPNVVYLGPVPNQQILPALRWLVGFSNKEMRRWFLVGSDYVFPRTANEIIRDEAKAKGCEIVGEEYLLLGNLEVGGVIEKIKKAKPDLIVNTINGDTNVAFFRALHRAGKELKDVRTLSFSVFEQELSALGAADSAGAYLAGNYFQSLKNPDNQEFLRRIAARYGPDRVVSSPMETACVGVRLWAQAVRAAGSDDVAAIRAALKGQQDDRTPQGPVRIDPDTQHTVQIARIGCVNAQGQVEEVFASPQPIVPEPFIGTRTRAEWLDFLKGLHQFWGGRWSEPGH
jgi:urea transport system substrate-binding protein